MGTVLAALIAMAAAAIPAGWEKVHTVMGPNAVLAGVVARGGDRWVAAGGDVIARGDRGGVQVTPETGKFIVGLASEGPEILLAVGNDDLILRWDGKVWVQESFAPDAAKLGRMERRALVLQGAFQQQKGPTVAYGPWRVLIRQEDGRWEAPPEKERYRLMKLAQLGPDLPRPKGCGSLEWRWLAGAQGWLSCHGGRNYVVAPDSTLTDRGRLPAPCADGIGTVVRRNDTLFATCDGGQLWRSEGTRWERVSAPKLDVIADDGRCLYGVSDKIVWRNCSLR